MKTIRYVMIILSALLIVSVQADNNRELIVLLDYQDTETVNQTLNNSQIQTSEFTVAGVSAITITALIALREQSAPILMSSSLIKNIYDHKKIFEDFLKLNVGQLEQKYSKYNCFRTPSAIEVFKESALYSTRMYKSVNKKIKSCVDKKKDIESIFNILIQDPTFGENNAPANYNDNINKKMTIYLNCLMWAPKSTNWIIKKVSDHLCLLVPKKYLTENKITEENLGLNLKNLSDLTDKNKFKYKMDPLGSTFLFDFKKLFTTDRKQLNWTLYFSGHGLPKRGVYNTIEQLKKLEVYYTKKLKFNKNQQITTFIKRKLDNIKRHIKRLTESAKLVGPHQDGLILSLNPKNWTSVLKFINANLKVNLLYYTSCFAGGEHLVAPYIDNKKNLILDFDVISGTLSENTAQQECPIIMLPPYVNSNQGNYTLIKGLSTDGIDLVNKKLKFITTTKFNKFFKSVRCGDHKNNKKLHELLSYLHPYCNEQKLEIYDNIRNIPSIRKAHSKKFVVIDSIPACTIFNDKNLNEKINLSQQKSALIYNDYIPQTIILNKNKKNRLPIFVSMMPGTASHMFERVEAPKNNLISIVQNFLQLPELSSSKIFWIKKLICAPCEFLTQISGKSKFKDVIVVRNMSTSDKLNQKIEFEDEYLKNTVYLNADNTNYEISWNGKNLNESNCTIKALSNNNHKHEILAYAPNLQKHLA